VYWSHGEGIARANANGSSVNTSFIPDMDDATIFGVAVNSQNIYFSAEKGVILRARLDGSDVDPDLFGIPQPPPLLDDVYEEEDAGCLVVAGAHVYWSVGEENDDAIGRADIDGGDFESHFISTGARVGAIAVDGSHIYWSGDHAIGRAELDGADIEPGFMPLIPSEGTGVISGIAIADDHIYWSADNSHSIGRANLDGRGVDQQFITSPDYVLNLAVAGRYIYWQSDNSFLMPTQKWIGRANIDGGGVESDLIDLTGEVTGEVYGGLAADTLGPGGGSSAKSTKRKRRR
jgi:hypothetical protein